jgi:transcriptional regulator with XRE-family HTH domain
MDTRKTGLFICLLRKQRGLTQSQLAERLGVTDKAVSRWETGKGFPDVSVLSPLAEALGTSVTELLAGEPLTAEEKAERSDSAVLEALRYTGSMGKPVLTALLAAAGCFLLISPLFMAGGTLGLRLAGLGLLLLAVLLSRIQGRLPALPLSRAAARTGTLLSLAATLLLELLPWGAVLVFARPASDGSIGRFRETYSYFSLMPVGYGNFFPLLTGLLTLALLGLGLLQRLRPRKKLGDALFILDAMALVSSVLPWVLFGGDYVSPVGLGITAALTLAGGFLALGNRGGENGEKVEKPVDKLNGN